jgi:hypothetical protein
MAEAGVALVTHGAGGLIMPPVEMLRAAGVLVFAGNDDIRDTDLLRVPPALAQRRVHVTPLLRHQAHALAGAESQPRTGHGFGEPASRAGARASAEWKERHD